MGSQNPTALVPNSKDEGSTKGRDVRAEIAPTLAEPVRNSEQAYAPDTAALNVLKFPIFSAPKMFTASIPPAKPSAS